jgi:hypothetical protein
LGVYITRDLKWHYQCNNSAATGNKVLGLLQKTFKAIDVKLAKTLYTSFVRPLLEYGVAAWSPYMIGDIDTIEKVQRRATKIPSETRNLDYEQRLKVFNLQTLENRRVRGDLIQQYKLNNGLEKINWVNDQIKTPSLSAEGPANSIRGHSQRILSEQTRVNCRRNFYKNRVVRHWNKLENEIINCKSLNAFKNNIDKWFENDKSAMAL